MFDVMSEERGAWPKSVLSRQGRLSPSRCIRYGLWLLDRDEPATYGLKQPGDRSCTSEAIGGAHYGPVMAYMTKVSDAASADGSTGWFKVFQDSWAAKSEGGSGDDDYWGTASLTKPHMTLTPYSRTLRLSTQCYQRCSWSSKLTSNCRIERS